MNNLYRLVFFTFCMSFYGLSYAQDCAEILQNAQSTYDEGQIHLVPEMLQSCMNNGGFAKEELVSAFRLLAMSYLILSEPEKADEAMLGLLKANPEYLINEAVDPTEFINLYNTFRTEPILRAGIRGGLGWSMPFISIRNGGGADPNYPKESLPTPIGGFQVGAGVELDMTKKIILNPEIFFMNQMFDERSVEKSSVSTTQYAISSLEVRATGHYNLINRPKFMLHGTFGLAGEYIMKASGNILKGEKYTREIPNIIDINESAPIDMKTKLIGIHPSVIGGVSARFKIGLPVISVDLRYKSGVYEMFINENQHDNPEVTISYNSFVLSNGYLQNAHVNVGINFPLYPVYLYRNKPLKLKKNLSIE